MLNTAAKFDTPSQAYLACLDHVLNHPDCESAPRGQPILECFDAQFEIITPSAEPIETKDSERNEVIKRYYAKELALYNSYTNSVERFAEASKFWRKIANPDGTVNSAYGHLLWRKRSCGNPTFENHTITQRGHDPFPDKELMRTPWEWAMMCLLRDRDTRQAIVRFSLPDHQWDGNKDQTCTMHGKFTIRHDKLSLSIVMRSCDLVKGLVYDLPWFCSLLPRMQKSLYDASCDVELGTFRYMAHSLHIYKKDLEKVKGMLGLPMSKQQTTSKSVTFLFTNPSRDV